MKRIMTALLAAAMVITAAGCSKDSSTDTAKTDEASSVAETIENADGENNSVAENDVKTTEADNGSDADTSVDNSVHYDEDDAHSAEIGEKLTNEFFEMTVNSAYRMKSVNGYTSNDEAYEFLCVNVKVKNNKTALVNVGTYDFTVRWGDDDESWDYAIEEEGFAFDGYPEEIDLKALQSVEGNVFFMVPVDAEVINFEYIVLYDDDTVGDTYYVELKDLEYMDDPNPAPENPVNYAAIGEAMSTDYFDMTVTDAFLIDEINGYYLDEGYTFLGVDTTLTNTTEATIETGAYYFWTFWGMGEEDYIYAVEEADVVDFPVITEIAAGESLSGIMYFVVPVDAELTFTYTDYYSDTEWVDYCVELGTPEKR